MKEVRIKTVTSPRICCRTTLWNVSGHQYRFTFILARMVRFTSGSTCFLFVFICSFIFSSWYWRHMTLVQYFVCCITHSFQLWGKTFGTALNNAQLTHPLTSGFHDSKHAYVLKANILNTRRKLLCVEKQRNNILCEHLPWLNVFLSLWS